MSDTVILAAGFAEGIYIYMYVCVCCICICKLEVLGECKCCFCSQVGVEL